MSLLGRSLWHRVLEICKRVIDEASALQHVEPVLLCLSKLESSLISLASAVDSDKELEDQVGKPSKIPPVVLL